MVTPMPQGGSNSDEGKYLGGFDDDYVIKVPASPSHGWGGFFGGPNPNTTTNLGTLREIGAGGYVASDAWIPANGDAPSIAGLQTLLIQAGLLDPDDLDHEDLGWYDDATRAAYTELLTRANASGSTWESTLVALRENPTTLKRKPEGSAPAPLVAGVTNPDDLKAVFRAAARRTLGSGSVDDTVLDRMVAAYQSVQVAAQQQEHAMRNGGGGTVTAPPDVEVFADQAVREIDPLKYDARKVVEKFDIIEKMFAGEA